MDKNSEKNVRFRINITLLIAVVLLVADLYAMINMPQKFIILAIITALFLVAIYFLVDSISIYLMAEKNRKEEQYDSIFKSEKASYLGKHLIICMNSFKKETSPGKQMWRILSTHRKQ